MYKRIKFTKAVRKEFAEFLRNAVLVTFDTSATGQVTFMLESKDRSRWMYNTDSRRTSSIGMQQHVSDTESLYRHLPCKYELQGNTIRMILGDEPKQMSVLIYFRVEKFTQTEATGYWIIKVTGQRERRLNTTQTKYTKPPVPAQEPQRG